MSGLSCLSCGAETNNGFVLCNLCQRKVSTDLEFLPVYFRNLARWRPGRAGSRQIPGSRVLYDGETRGTGDRIGDALDAAHNALVTWARLLIEDRPDFPRPQTFGEAYIAGNLPDDIAEQLAMDSTQSVTLLCAGLRRHLTSIATREWAGEFVSSNHVEGTESDGIGYHEQRLCVLTETSIPGWYAGKCMRVVTMEGGTCGGKTYVVPGLTWANCSRCGATTYAQDHLEVILEEARTWVAKPKRLAEAIVALVDGEQSVFRLRKRISKWGDRERIEVVRGDVYAAKHYRLGDVLDRLYAEGPTRLNDDVATKVG